MKYVHISAKVERRIETLKKSGKAAKALAQKAEHIIESLTSGSVRHHMDAVGSFTRYGEKRIKHCRKYDLGCGYRLVSLQRGMNVFIPFLGTHDGCQRWLETNSRLKKIAVGKGTFFPIPDRLQSPEMISDNASADFDADDKDDLLSDINDKILRRIFSGLVEAAGKRTS